MLIGATACAGSSVTMSFFGSPRLLWRNNFLLCASIAVTKAVDSSQKGVAALGKSRASVFLLHIYVYIRVWVCVCVWGYCESIAHAGSKQQDNTVIEDISFAFWGSNFREKSCGYYLSNGRINRYPCICVRCIYLHVWILKIHIHMVVRERLWYANFHTNASLATCTFF